MPLYTLQRDTVDGEDAREGEFDGFIGSDKKLSH